MIYVILGAPGSGKGTRAGILKEKLGITHISTGNLIRENKEIYEKYKDVIINGNLVPDDVIAKLLRERIENEQMDNGCMIDGYPRTLEQAYKLDDMLSDCGKRIKKVFLLEADEDTIYSRILNRMVCSKCGETYNKEYADKNNNKCGKCGHDLILRKDDNIETLKNRIDAYYDNIDRIKEYYKQKGVLEIIDALEKADEILERVK